MKTLLTIITLLANITTGHAEFTIQDIHEVRAFVYDYSQDDKSSSLLQNGKLHKGVINAPGVKLSKQQVKRLKIALKTSNDDGSFADCYMPHHGFVFYNIQGKAIGHIELCFQCGTKDSTPKNLSARSWDWGELKKILEELKIPILKEDKDYTKLFKDKQTKTKKANK